MMHANKTTYKNGFGLHKLELKSRYKGKKCSKMSDLTSALQSDNSELSLGVKAQLVKEQVSNFGIWMQRKFQGLLGLIQW